LTRLGEGLSYDESLLAFWGAWGTETKTIRLYCRTTGNQDRRDFCNHVGNFTGGLGDPKSTCIDANDVVIYPCYQEKEVPVNQGIFVLDLANNNGNNVLYLIARVGDGGSFDDFVYWNYSGAPLGVGSDEADADREPPRFRSSAFVSVSSADNGITARVVFKARTGDLNATDNTYIDPVDGIYLKTRLIGQASDSDSESWSPRSATTVVKTGDLGTDMDVDAVFPEDAGALANSTLIVDELAMERESLRGDALVATVGFTGTYTDDDGAPVDVEFAGIYLARL
jgi:hypothetical protein